MDQSVKEINKQGSYQPPDNQRHRSRLPETSSPRERHRYEVTDRRYRYDRSDGSYRDKLIPSQWMEAKLFLDKIAYFDGSNNKEALNFWHNVKKLPRK